MILTRRQDDIIIVNKTTSYILPLIHFFLSYWEMNGLSTDLILINVVSTISKTGLSLSYNYYISTRIITN